MTFFFVNTALQTFCLLAIGAAVWVQIANYRTHTDITVFVESVRHRPVTAPRLLNAYRKVGYNRHLRARFFGRDPWALYDPIVRDALDHPRTEVIAGGMEVHIGPEGAVHEEVHRGTRH